MEDGSDVSNDMESGVVVAGDTAALQHAGYNQP